MTPRNTNKDNLELILYRLDELKETIDRNYQAQIEANQRSSEQHSANTLAIARLENKVAHLEKDFLAHFDDTKSKKITTDWAKVLVGIFGALATLIAGYIAIKGA